MRPLSSRRNRRLAAIGATLFGLLAIGAMPSSVSANAQAYPSKPITIVVPFGAGSGTDMISRIVAQHLGSKLKQTIVVENKPGANGMIAATYVARAAPDGYTLLMSTNSPHSAAPGLAKSMAYDPVKDFAPITRVGSYLFTLVVNPEVPAKTVPELIALAKASPGKLTFASGNTTGIVAGETFKHLAGIDILHVPYKSVPPALNDLLGGRISMMFVDLTASLPHVRANKLRALAVTMLERSTLLPELPSMHQAGVPEFEIDPWAGLFAPANTPADIIKRLNSEVRAIVDSPEVKGHLADLGFQPITSTPEELGEFVKLQLVKWTKMIKEAGIEPQ